MAMTGYVFDIRHYSVHDGPGIRTSVFLKGCPLRCRWCHNPESQDMLPVKVVNEKRIGDKLIRIPEVIGNRMGSEDVFQEVIKSRIFFEESGGGVTFSGGEPLMQAGFLLECIRLMKQNGLHVALDTCGYAQPGQFEQVVRETDLVLFDLKHTVDALHRDYTGGALEPVFRNLKSRVLAEKGLIIRIPLIPGFNMSPDVYKAMADLLTGMSNLQQIDLLPYHYTAVHKYRRLGREYRMNGIKEPAKPEVDAVVHYFSERGFRVTTGG